MKKSIYFERSAMEEVLLYFIKKWLIPYIEIVKGCVDCMIWFKIDKSIMPNCVDLYLCAIYMPPDRNVFLP